MAEKTNIMQNKTGWQKLGLVLAGTAQGYSGQPYATNIINSWQNEIEQQNAQRKFEAEQAQIQFQNQMAQRQLATERQKIMADAWYKRQMIQNGVPITTMVNGELQTIGTIPKGGKFVPPVSMMTPEQKSVQEVETATAKAKIPTADMRNMAASVENQIANIKQLRKETEGLKGGYEGIFNRLVGGITRGKEQGSTLMYERKKPAYAVGLYRALTGDTRLSDADAAARAYPLLWDTSLDKSLQKPMFDDIENALLARKIMLSTGMGETGKEGGIVTPLNQVTDMAKKISQAKEKGYSDEEITKYFEGKNGK